MRQASGISERGPSRPEAYITTGRSGLCIECDQRVEPWHEVLLGDEDDPLMHVECAEGDSDDHHAPDPVRPLHGLRLGTGPERPRQRGPASRESHRAGTPDRVR